MNTHHRTSFAIIGGGIGGLTLALQRKGFEVAVYEGAPVFKPLGAGLGLAGNALKAFREIGIEEDVIGAGKVLKNVEIRNPKGKVLIQTNSEEVSKRFGVVNNLTIARADLHDVLIGKVKAGTVQLDKALVDFTQTPAGVELHFKDGTTANHSYAIAADGIHSVVRKKLVPGSEPRYAGYTCWRGMTDQLPEGFDAETTMETWGNGARMGIVPQTKGRVYWFACVNARPNDALMRTLNADDLLTYFRNFHAPIPEILKRTPKDRIIWNDIIDIEPIRRFAFGRIVLIGDAAHATTPNMGQGACMAIEDAAILSNCIASSSNPEAAFVSFETKRIRRTTKIVNDSWQLGKMAQWENPIMTLIRNRALSWIPKRMADNQFKFIYDVQLK